VHGSHMAQLAMTIRTALTGQVFTIEFDAAPAPPHKVTVRDAAGRVVKVVAHGSGALEVENLAVLVREKRHGVLGARGWRGAVMLVSTGRWLVEAASKPFPNPSQDRGKSLLDIQIIPNYDADHDVVAPHGLIGQSWDGDNIGIDGAQDNYTAAEVTTKAMAEGAIEGVASDYEMEHKFATAFKFSRFDAVTAKPRDVSKLLGERSTGRAFGAGAGAKPDVEADGAAAEGEVDAAPVEAEVVVAAKAVVAKGKALANGMAAAAVPVVPAISTPA